MKAVNELFPDLFEGLEYKTARDLALDSVYLADGGPVLRSHVVQAWHEMCTPDPSEDPGIAAEMVAAARRVPGVGIKEQFADLFADLGYSYHLFVVREALRIASGRPVTREHVVQARWACRLVGGGAA